DPRRPRAGGPRRLRLDRVRDVLRACPDWAGALHSRAVPPTSDLDRLYLDHVIALQGQVERLLAGLGWDAMVVHSGSPARRSGFDDQHWPLRPVPHWQHWSSLAEADCALVVRPGRRPKLLRQHVRSFWEAPAPVDIKALDEAFDVAALGDAGDVRRELSNGHTAFVGEDAGRAQSWGIEADGRNPPPLMRALDALRTTKTPYEVACIAEANRRARAGHEALFAAFRQGDASELDLHLRYLQATAQDDWETPYKNIVALGPSAATLHHVSYTRGTIARESESLLVDAGATCRGYCADVTRTWVKGIGGAARAFAALISAVDAMQTRLSSAVRVGERYEALHDESHHQVAEILRSAGIVRTSADEAVARGVTRAFYPHGLGHSLGLQTHDVGCATREPQANNPFLRNTTDIAVGQVFTIEPGIYFIEDLLERLRASPAGASVHWPAVGELSPFGGVRVEDDIHVTGDARVIRNLTREHLPSGGGVG
ncbi:MAG: Xaa-Pro dipeptidase, partial [Polyangiaceae bacterium]